MLFSLMFGLAMGPVAADDGVHAPAAQACDMRFERQIELDEDTPALQLVVSAIGESCRDNSILVQVFRDDGYLLYTSAIRHVNLVSHSDWDRPSLSESLQRAYGRREAIRSADLPAWTDPPLMFGDWDIYEVDQSRYENARASAGWVFWLPLYWEGSVAIYYDPAEGHMFELLSIGA
jgi:hypothetical protein